MPKFLGVDGGGTKTRILCSDSHGNVTHDMQVGATNHQSSEFEEKNLIGALEQFAGMHFSAAAFTMSGWDFASDKNRIQNNIQNALQANQITVGTLEIENDSIAVLKTGLQGDEDGVVFIAGTGCMGAACVGDEIYRHYGFGYLSGEWGGGDEVARYALHRVFASEQERELPCPLLREKALKHFRVKSVLELIEKISQDQISADQVGRFLGQVVDANDEGCTTSKHVLNKAGREHGKSIASLLSYLDIPGPIVLGGGMFERFGILPGMREFLQETVFDYSEIRLVKSAPVYGALKWALQVGEGNSEVINDHIEIEVLK